MTTLAHLSLCRVRPGAPVPPPLSNAERLQWYCATQIRIVDNRFQWPHLTNPRRTA